MGFAIFSKRPTSHAIRTFHGRTVARRKATPTIIAVPFCLQSSVTGSCDRVKLLLVMIQRRPTLRKAVRSAAQRSPDQHRALFSR